MSLEEVKLQLAFNSPQLLKVCIKFTLNKLTYLLISEPSSPPIDVTADAKGPTVIKVTWRAPPKDDWNGEIQGYYVGYKVLGSSQQFSFRTVEAVSNYEQWHVFEFCI